MAMKEEPIGRKTPDFMLTATDAEIDTPCTGCLQDEEKQVEAVVFCLECSEHMCAPCRQHHQKLKLTRAHHLIEIIMERPIEGKEKNQTESCSEHQDKCIEYFCAKHQVLCCKTCRDIDHKDCSNVKLIIEEASGIVEKGEVTDIEESLRNVTTKLANQIQDKRQQMTDISNQAADALTKIRAEKKDTVDQINKLANEAENDVKAKSFETNNKLKNDIETMESVLETLHTTGNGLTTIKQNASEPQIYVAVKKANYQLKKYSAYADAMTSNTKKPTVQFKLDSIFNSLQNLRTMGEVTIYETEPEDKKRHIRKRSPGLMLLTKPKKAIPIGGHSVHIQGDKTTCHITGSEILPDGRIILADHNNKSVKLFNKNCTYINHITTSSRPTDLALLNENEIATSLIDEKVIQVLKIGSNLSLSRRITTLNPYYGLVFYTEKTQLFGSTSTEDGTGEIHALDTAGNIEGIIKKISVKVELIRPSAIRIDKNNLLYVNDLGSNSVFCLDISKGFLEFREVFTYTDRNLELRSGLALDTDGNVYVSSGNMTVHQIFKGQKIHEILTSADGLGLPHCLAFSAGYNHLLVSEFKENSFKLFALR